MAHKIYAVELNGGSHICLNAATGIAAAKREAYEEEGRNNVTDVRLATDEEIAWVQAMGGYVPDLAKMNAKGN